MPESILSREAHFVQNPALGATLLWRFAQGYGSSHRTGEAPPIPLAFIVLPLLFHRDSGELLVGTKANLATFAEKFSRPDTAKADVLLSLHERTLAARALSLQSLRLAVQSRLVTVVPADARFASLSSAQPSGVASSVRPLLSAAERLGKWCSSLTLFEIGNVLKVDF
ncbi:MAG: three component ABC system middle component [Acidobacteriota bacterium]|jgi:hypothetical protein